MAIHNPQALLVTELLAAYRLDPWGIHGLRHWARVLENGLRLAAATGADLEVVTLFALFHDSCRWNDGSDREHGHRGADLARSWLGHHLHLAPAQFELLYAACRDHTGGRATPEVDITIRTCWDADRLDLLRVGNAPRTDWLGTDAARALIPWANARAGQDATPEIVKEWVAQ